MINPDGLMPATNSEIGGWAAWSPDSRWLYFANLRADGSYLILEKER